jgi:hypothetical protein
LEIKEEALKKAISEIPDERQKEEASNYLERLMILYNQEIENRKKSAGE